MKEKVAFGTYKSIKKLNFAYNQGIRIFDTAESYFNGDAEKAISKIITDRKNIIIISKVSPENLKFKDVINSAINSAKRLKTIIDFYLIHIPNPKISLEETFRALEFLKKNKVIRFYGVSNFPLELLKETKKYNISAIQEEFSLPFQYNIEHLNYARKSKILFFAYRPLSGGDIFIQKNLDNLKDVCLKYKKNPAAVALKWIQEKGAIPIIGSSNEKHIVDDLDLDWEMSKEDVEKLEKMNWIHN